MMEHVPSRQVDLLWSSLRDLAGAILRTSCGMRRMMCELRSVHVWVRRAARIFMMALHVRTRSMLTV